MALRNVIPRRQHKERSQPAHRRRLGLLEKHKDYVLRARDHHSKQDRLKRLREKAATRNPDEFYFGMVRSRTENGVHIASRTSRSAGTGLTAMPNDVVSLLKTQDAAYLRKRIMTEGKTIDALRDRIASLLPFLRTSWIDDKEGRRQALSRAKLLVEEGGRVTVSGDEARIGAVGKKTVFVEGADEVRAYKPPKSSEGETRVAGQVDADDAAADERARRSGVKAAEKHAGYLVTELRARQTRLDALQEASQKLSVVRALMTNRGGSVRKLDARAEKLKDAVAQGKVTKEGLALPGNEEDDDDEVGEGFGGAAKPKRTLYKFGRERKR